MVEAQIALRAGTLDFAQIAIFEKSRVAQIEKLIWQRGALAQIEAELEAKRLELVAAARDRKVIEKLEESQFEKYLEKLNREEQAFLDELAAHQAANYTGA
jgi:flagellar export protein FliJ